MRTCKYWQLQGSAHWLLNDRDVKETYFSLYILLLLLHLYPVHFIEKEREGTGKRGEARTGEQSGGRGDRREEEQRGVRKGEGRKEGREFWTHLHAQTISRLCAN